MSDQDEPREQAVDLTITTAISPATETTDKSRDEFMSPSKNLNFTKKVIWRSLVPLSFLLNTAHNESID